MIYLSDVISSESSSFSMLFGMYASNLLLNKTLYLNNRRRFILFSFWVNKVSSDNDIAFKNLRFSTS